MGDPSLTERAKEAVGAEDNRGVLEKSVFDKTGAVGKQFERKWP